MEKIEIGLLRGGVSGFGRMIPDGLRDLMDRPGSDYVALGAAADRSPCGVLVASPENDGFRVRHLFIDAEYRRRGVGTQLLGTFAEGIPPLPHGDAVRCFFTSSEAEPAPDAQAAFWRACGFSVAEAEGGLYQSTLGALAELPFWKQAHAPSPSLVPFSGLSAAAREELRRFVRRFAANLNLVSPPYGETGLLRDLSYAFLPDGRIRGLAVVSRRAGLPDGSVGAAGPVGPDGSAGAGALELSWLYCEPEHVAGLPGLLRALYVAASRENTADCPFHISAVNAASAKLVKKLCPGAAFSPLLEATGSFAALRASQDADRRIRALTRESEGDLSWWDEAAAGR
ncbi:MAG: GNAT family N-acetyltransferase [Clostridiales Family XIII bacterium]|jgi:GNAT superfamily N-acetyltransferase|nr:GNAT family N-acetyltransferase [Clostridiales Family XIII bacterium]